MNLLEMFSNLFKKKVPVMITTPSLEEQQATLIKGNVNRKGEKIYHIPGGKHYDNTNATEFFTTIEEAEASGFRPSKR